MKWPHHRTGVCLVSRMFNIDHSTAPAGPLYPLAPSFSPFLQHPVHPSLPGPFPWEALRMEVSQCMEYEILGADPSFLMCSGHPPWCSGLGISPLWFSFLQPGTWETALDQPLVPCEEGRNNSPLPHSTIHFLFPDGGSTVVWSKGDRKHLFKIREPS